MKRYPAFFIRLLLIIATTGIIFPGCGNGLDLLFKKPTMSVIGDIFTVTYNGNGSTGGNIPTDSTNYDSGNTVTVLGNTGNLAQTGFTFTCWNTQANGSGTDCIPASTFTIGSSDVTLFAKWTASPIATVSTTAIAGNLTFTVDINGTGAKGGGDVSDQGGSAVTERGLCWSTTSGNATISGTHAVDGSGTGVFSDASMTGLSVNTTYYVRAYATNLGGTAYGNEISFNSGQIFRTDHAGGYVFYNNGSGGGLVSAKTDQGTREWITGGLTQDTSNDNTNLTIGTGLANSNAIIAQTDHTGSAAQVCLDYDDGSYSDWYLPSLNELILMYTRLKAYGFGGFGDIHYWSSSEGGPNSAIELDFSNCGTVYNFKSASYYVRPVRDF